MGNLRGSPAKLENDDEGCVIEQGSPLGGGLPAAEARAEDEREGQQDADGACGRGATWGGEGRLQSGQTWQARSLLEWPVTKDGEKGQEWGHSPAELSVTPHIYNLPYVLPPGPAGQGGVWRPLLGTEHSLPLSRTCWVFHPAPSTQKDTNEFKMLLIPSRPPHPTPAPAPRIRSSCL